MHWSTTKKPRSSSTYCLRGNQKERKINGFYLLIATATREINFNEFGDMTARCHKRVGVD